MASILVVSGPQQGAFFPLARRTVVVGRDEGSTLQIVDATVSRRHMEIRYEPAKQCHLVRDVGSANGTSLNDLPLEAESPLADGDVMTVGSSELMFSAMDFSDRDTAFAHYRRRGERTRSTIIRRPDSL